MEDTGTRRRQRTLTRLAQRQHGLVTRRQALASGMTAGQVDGRVHRGQWEVMHPGVYRPAPCPATTEQQILAACLAGGPASVASHRSAAWLWGLMPTAAMVVEITVPIRLCRRIQGTVVHRSERRGEDCTRRGIPLTSPVLTIVNLAAVVGTSDLHSALDVAGRRRLVTADDVLLELERIPRAGTPGVTRLRQVLDDRGGPGVRTSALERRMLALIRRYRLPPPVVELPVGPGHRYRADLAYPAARLLIEVDGFDTHSTPSAQDADLHRQNQLVAEGWQVLRYTWRTLSQRPALVAAQIAAQIAAGQPPSEQLAEL